MIEKLRLEYAASNEYRLNNLNLTLFKGEILGIVSQGHTNRKGVMRLMTGDIAPDSGSIWVDGTEALMKSRLDAKKKGIGSVRMRSQLVPNMSIAENIFVNREGSYFSALHRNAIYVREANELLKSLGADGIPASIRALYLSPAEHHIVEIAKAVSSQSSILILDHITEQYNEEEMMRFIKLLRTLKEAGISIVFLTNKYSRLFSVADRCYVIREGTTAAHIGHGNITEAMLYKYLSQVPLVSPVLLNHTDEKLLLTASKIKARSFPEAEFHVKHGEILGISEPDWEFASALGNILSGRCSYNGRISINGKDVRIDSPQIALKYGIGLVPENIHGHATIADMSLVDNITLNINRKYDRFRFLINKRLCSYIAKSALKELSCDDILEKYETRKYLGKVNRIDELKIVLAKWLSISPQMLVMLNPHFGFNEEELMVMNQMIRVLAEKGIAVVMISTNLSSVASMCNRVISAGSSTII